jgi:peroxiredoxin
MANPLQVGQKAPDFSVPGVVGQDERTYSLSDYLGKQNVILVFYVYDWTGI